MKIVCDEHVDYVFHNWSVIFGALTSILGYWSSLCWNLTSGAKWQLSLSANNAA